MSRFYLSKKTFLIAIIATMILEPIGMIMETRLNDLIPFEWLAFFVLYGLLIGLLITRRKQDYVLMNGIVSGMLIYLFVRYVYLFSYFSEEAVLSYYRSAGIFVCFCLAFLFVSIAAVCLITYNHFTINRSRAVNRTKIILNQFLLLLSFSTPILCIMDNLALGYSVYEIITYAAVYISDALILLVVACCELQLSMNRKDETPLEKPVLSDVKAALWYAFSFLFGLLCLVMGVLLQSTKAFVFILSNTDLLLSLGLLIYYLNRKKQPSFKLRIFLGIALVTTIVLTVIFIGCFVWKILS